mgnify:CR=1 FL=1
MDWLVGVEEKEDGIYIGGVKVEDWRFSFYHDTYEEVVKQLGPEWTIYDLLNITLKQGWTVVARVPDTEPPKIHWAGYTGDMKTIRASVSDNEQVESVIAHVKVGDSYRDVNLTDEDGDLIFTATLSEEITDTSDDYIIASDGRLKTIWNNIHVIPDWWRMFQHDATHKGFSYSSVPDNNSVLWSYEVGATVWSSPAVADGKVFFGTTYRLGTDEESGTIHCLDANTGEEIWSYTPDTGYMVGRITSSPVVADGKVFFSSWNRIYCLDANTGKLVWSNPGVTKYTMAVAYGKVFVVSSNVYCLDADTGEEIWRFEYSGYRDPPAVADGKVIVNRGSSYDCLDADTGDRIWDQNIPGTRGRAKTSAAIANGKVFFGTGWYGAKGMVICLGILPPVAHIDSISPETAVQGKDTVIFEGHGTDIDGHITAYEWRSDKDGVLSTSKSFSMPASTLSLGTHNIFFKVKDDDGVWSVEDVGHITIKPPSIPVDLTPPVISFVPPTPENNSYVSKDWVYVNVSVSAVSYTHLTLPTN